MLKNEHVSFAINILDVFSPPISPGLDNSFFFSGRKSVASTQFGMISIIIDSLRL